MEGPLDTVESLALLEIDGMARAVLVQDAALKHAPITVMACAPVSPGKVILIFFGAVAPVEEAFGEACRLAGSRLMDSLLLPFIHPAVVAAVGGEHFLWAGEGLAILEFSTVAATLLACDTAVKCAAVRIGRLHLAAGFGGKGFLTLCGDLGDLEAAVAAASERLPEHLTDAEIVPAPHSDLGDRAFIRPWAADPALPGG